MIQAWVTLDVFLSFWFFKNIRVAKAIYKDVNGQPLMESFIDKDEM
jgi:hypothetical protein